MLEKLGLVAESPKQLKKMAQNSCDRQDAVHSLIRRRLSAALIRQCVLGQSLDPTWLKSQGLANTLEALQQICDKVDTLFVAWVILVAGTGEGYYRKELCSVWTVLQ